MFHPIVRRPSVAAALSLPLLLAACVSPPPPPPPPPVVTAPVPAPVEPPPVQPVEAEPRAPATQLLPPQPGPIGGMLAYADRLRTLSSADLSAEISRLGDPGEVQVQQMRLGLALAQTRSSSDLAKALSLMQRAAANSTPEGQALQPLARVLAARYQEQRRVEEDRDRQAQQVKDAQRRIDQLNDRLEAVRAIERSFGRPSPNPAVPNGSRH